MSKLYENYDTYVPDNLLATPAIQLLLKKVTLTGAKFTKGSVIALATTGKKGSLVDSSKTDGTQVPYGILAEDTDASSADVKAEVYVTGHFNSSELKFGGTDTAATHEAELRKQGIYLD